METMTRKLCLTRDTASNKDVTLERYIAREEFLYCAFLLGSDRKRYGKLIENLENDCVLDIDMYPKTLVATDNLQVHWKQDPKNLMRRVKTTSDGITFANVGGTERREAEPNAKRRREPHVSCIECPRCHVLGHYAEDCPTYPGTRQRFYRRNGESH
jgi:hypothetical protein